MPGIKAAQYEGYLDGTEPAPPKLVELIKEDKTKHTAINPDYERWLKEDQQLLAHINNSLSREVLGQVAMMTTSADVWTALSNMYAAQSQARVTNLRMQLVNCKKGGQTAAAYFGKMKTLGDELAAAGRPVPDEELVTFILAGLDFDYNPLVSSVVGRTNPISLSELYAQILAYDMRLQMLQDNAGHSSSVNAASRGRGGCRGRGNFGRGYGGRGNNNNNISPPPKAGGQGGAKPICQVCKKKGHEADVCRHCFEEDYQPNVKTAGAASMNYGVDTNWYADSGATDHITAELEKLSVRDKYKGSDKIHTASGLGMQISNIGHAILHTPNKNLHLQNVLHVPSANKSLVSVHRLTSDNNTYIEFHPHYFLIKDRATKRVLHRGKCEGGLYPFKSQEAGAQRHKQACRVARPSTWRWHSRLGHASFPVVERVIRNNSLPCSFDHDSE